MKFKIMCTCNYLGDEVCERWVEKLKKFDFDEENSVINLKNLEELLLLQSMLDEEIIVRKTFDEKEFMLEIYDDYRE